ncbi:hypothetical protein BJX61DRAFT_533812 [Aspergillus egyptiacus]|nr:hypothetical protein BJX61DRAFT_533812 [Aspergillus egyptiacus]
MRFSHDHLAILRDPRVLLFGILYSAVCITCIIVLAWRNSRRQRRRRMFKGQMDLPSEKGGGEQSPGATSPKILSATHKFYGLAPLPSACDVLQPLSRVSQLPPSGYLAAALGRERENRMEQTYQHEGQRVQLTSSPRSGHESPLMASPTDHRHGVPLFGTESSPTRTEDSSQAMSPLNAADLNDEQDISSSPNSGDFQSIQKRSQGVHFLHDVDENGFRTWRRWLIPVNMTVTTYAVTTDPSDLAALNLSRLLTRLEHNLLSANADLTFLRRSEYQRMRVSANIEYARTNLQLLERSLPQIKPVDRRHELQTTLARNRQTLKRLQNVLDEIQSEAEIRASSAGTEWDDDTDEGDDLDSEDLLGTPEGGSTADEATPGDDISIEGPAKDIPTTTATMPPASTVEPSAISAPTATDTAAPTLRNRHHNTSIPTSPDSTGTSTGSSLRKPSEPSKTAAETDGALATDRLEQENLTASLLDLATQLKTSSQAFQSSLEAEKSVLSRAAEGLDRTTGSLAAAERRMGMLRRMTEGKGWWGRMMLYAWIFALLYPQIP